jgi:hypothetical protein
MIRRTSVAALLIAAAGISASAQTLTISAGVAKRPISTVAGLPACNGGVQGQMYMVTDALAPVALAAVASGGAVIIGVTCNGTSWIVQ